MKQESHSSSSSSSSPSSPTVGDLSVREREDVTNSDISPVPVSEFVDDRSGRPDETQANKTTKTNTKETTIERGDPLCSDDSEIPEWLQEFRENLVDDEIPLQGGSHASSSHERTRARLARLREEAASARPVDVAPDLQAEVTRLRAELAEAKGEGTRGTSTRPSKGLRAPKGRRNDAAYSSRVVGLDEPQTTRSSRTSRVWRFLAMRCSS